MSEQTLLEEIKARKDGLVEAIKREPEPAPGRERIQRAVLERLLLDIDWLVPQVENWHAYLRWRGEQDEREGVT